MANIDKNKIGDSIPDAILFNNHLIEQSGEELWSWLKWANDAGGYFVHGLTILPTTSWGPYSWPWDIGVTGGGLKDDNNGSRYWGYVNDGQNKDLSNGINKTFPANVNGDHNVCICLCNETVATNGIDLGEVPIVIEFLDDRFDDATWAVNTGCEVTIEGRKITINKVAPDGKGLVATASWTDKSIENARAKMADIKANVTGLTWHKATFTKPIDPSSVECWDIKVGNDTIYHKDRTVENCWKKYKLLTETQIEPYQGAGEEYTCYDVTNNSGISNLHMPDVTDWESYVYNLSSKKFIRWKIKAANERFWEPIREYYTSQSLSPMIARLGLFNGSNMKGSLHLKITAYDPSIFDFEDFMNDTQISDLTIELGYDLLSCHNMFRKAQGLKNISIVSVSGNPITLRARDVSGMFEFCDALKTYPSTLIKWNDRSPTNDTNIGYFCDFCSNLEIIPSNGSVRTTALNTCIASYAAQAFSNCPKLTYIGPVIDFSKISNATYVYHTFYNADNITDARIKGLNHFNWHLDGTESNGVLIGDLPNLDNMSVLYLFSTLTDLTAHDPSKNDPDSENYDPVNPIVSNAELHCPAEWEEKISDTMLSEANAKGWTVYVGGTIKTV